MKRLVLHKLHENAGAEFFSRNDWLLPKNYQLLEKELHLAREIVAVHDFSYLGKVFLRGNDTLDLLQNISTNDLTQLEAAGYLPTIFCDARGRLVDYVHLIHFAEGKLAISCHANTSILKNWLERFIITEDVVCEDRTNEFIFLMLSGLEAKQALFLFSGNPINEEDDFFVLKQNQQFAALIKHKFAKWPTFFLLLCGEEKTTQVKNLLEIVKKIGGSWIGYQAAEVLRMESGLPAGGTEINDRFNPHEARLLHAVSFTKGCYTGQEVIARLDTYDKVQKYSMIVELQNSISETLPIDIYLEDQIIGQMTSYGFDAHRQKHLGLAYIKKNYAFEDFQLKVQCGDFKVPAVLHLPPWIKEEGI